MHLLERFPEAELTVFIVWTDVFAADGPEGAREAASLFSDGRVRVLHDAGRRVGRALAPLCGLTDMEAIVDNLGGDVEQLERFYKPGFLAGPPTLFDSLFFFGPNAEWGGAPPRPDDWITQLVPQVHAGIPPERFFWEHAFYAELERRAASWLRHE